MKKLESNPDSIQRKDIKGLKLTDWDRKNIAYCIEFYRKAFPGVIEEIANQARLETVAISKQKSWKSGPLNFTRRLAMPAGLLQRLKEAYPALIVDKGQFEQFLRWFPEFDVLER